MASCSVGGLSIKLLNLNFCRARVGIPQQQNGLRMCIGARPLQFAAVSISCKSKRLVCVYAGLSSDTESHGNTVEGPAETKSSGLKSSEIESLVTEICNTASIAEFELKHGGFHLYVMRDIAEGSEPAPLHVPPPALAPASVSDTKTAKAHDSNGAVSSASLAVSAPPTSSGGIQSFLDKAADEGLMILQSPRVGFFRRSRTIKGKRAPPSCKEKQMVKEGQVLCYIEQLGGELPIESDVSGEVIKILLEDGEPVGYGDALIAILPSFPGIMLQ